MTCASLYRRAQLHIDLSLIGCEVDIRPMSDSFTINFSSQIGISVESAALT